jgi:hypothetical protein
MPSNPFPKWPADKQISFLENRIESQAQTLYRFTRNGRAYRKIRVQLQTVLTTLDLLERILTSQGNPPPPPLELTKREAAIIAESETPLLAEDGDP